MLIRFGGTLIHSQPLVVRSWWTSELQASLVYTVICNPGLHSETLSQKLKGNGFHDDIL